MPRYHVINGTEVQFTPEEETARDAEEKAWEDGAEARATARVQANRRNAYQAEADHLFFEEQRGEVAAGTWAAKVDEIKARFPK
jgi:hypothetical protein